jgi:hypothetical protein
MEPNSSDLIVAKFAFPSRATDEKGSRAELDSVYKCLRPNGLLVTIGWDETFNDELSEMWYKYAPDAIVARSFEEWRYKRVAQFESPRNCRLKWLVRGLNAPVEFGSPKTAVRVMGYLFGKSAADKVIRSNRVTWSQSVGITLDPKEGLGKILSDWPASRKM